MDDWGFPLIFLVALLLGVVLSLWQHRAYSNRVRTVAMRNDRSGLSLVSGRGKGFLRGSVVILVIDTLTDQIVDAEVMTGSTIFARFKAAPELLGSLKSVKERTENKFVLKALDDAMVQVKALKAGRSRTAKK